MNVNQYVNTLSVSLPEDILKRKWAGDFEGALQAIEHRLKKELPEYLRNRLVCEKERLRRLPTQYPWTKAEALEKLRSLVPGVTEEQFDEWELSGRIDFIYIHGEKRYFVRFHRSIAMHPELLRLAGKPVDPHNEWRDSMMHAIKNKGKLGYRITLEASVYVDQDAFVPGEYLAHLPFPAEAAQQRDIQLLAGDPDGIAPADAPARSVYWRKTLEAWQEFKLQYRFTNEIKYADPRHLPAPEQPLYPQAGLPADVDLSESGAFIRFTPYLRALTADVIAGARTAVEKAWNIYEYITTKIDYSFMRDYFQIDDIGEYCAINLRGDCGLQALLFINMCRIAGIPARWQSGLALEPTYCGSHDWAQFYLDGWGWLFADCSYGGSAYRYGSTERHAFYFGNLDPMRMAANREFQAPLTPELQVQRIDPYDNQSGEIERIGAELPFTMRQINSDIQLLSWEDIDTLS